MGRPFWFSIKDFLTYGLISIICTALACISWFVEIRIGGYGVDTRLGFFLASVISVASYSYILVSRKKYLDGFEWFPRFGLMIKSNGLSIRKQEVDDLIERTIEGWLKETNLDIKPIIFDNPIFITFCPDALRDRKGRNVLGYCLPNSYEIHVAVSPNQTLVETSLEHELNHLIYGNYTKKWNERVHHEYFVDIGFTNPS